MSSWNGRADILTSSGRYFDYLEPEENNFDIEDIAFGLSRLCRFAGQLRRELLDDLYSVAQHSVLVSRLVPAHLALNGLMHDAAEAFMVDVPRPLKQMLSDYKFIERRVEGAVLARFNLPYPMPEHVHLADRLARRVETRDLMAPHDFAEDIADLAHVERIVPWTIRASREAFLARYAELTT